MSDNNGTHKCVSGSELFLAVLLIVMVLGLGYAMGRSSRDEEMRRKQSLYDKILTRMHILETSGERIQAAGFKFESSKNSSGVRVSKVYLGTAADKAGMRIGDIILSVNGKPAEDYDALKIFSDVAYLRTNIPVEVRRGDRILHMQITPTVILRKIVIIAD